jgi:hypothetical protein
MDGIYLLLVYSHVAKVFGKVKNCRERAVAPMDALGTRPIKLVPRPDDFNKTRRGCLFEPN